MTIAHDNVLSSQLEPTLERFIATMKLQTVLLFVVLAVNVVISCKWKSIKFPLRLLQPDLQAISQYYDKVEALNAFIHWPDSIPFSIQMVKGASSNDFYLKTSGTFRITTMAIMSTTYDGIYYRNGQFSVKEVKTNVWKEILPDTKVTYEYPKTMVTTTKAYLTIKYFGLNELKETVEPFYLRNQNFVSSVLKENPVTFLANVPSAKGHFVEYTFWGENTPNTLADGKLQVLFGSGKKGKLILTNATEAYRLVFDQRRHTFTIPENFHINSRPLSDVFGVRMATKGFLVEVHGNSVLTLSNDDLTYGHPIVKQHSMFVHDLLQKVKTVEPRNVFTKNKWVPSIWTRPISAKFQLHGQVLVKRVNIGKNGYIDINCPYTIEYANEGRQFLFGQHWVDKIYTDDRKLWVAGEGPVPDQQRTVSLMY